ncbi:hypothetical protein [Nonomuraea sp. 3-1Str]|uniref:hypothetical protein n=1 Tax=Nonomuraea sp. 3-1Str TaxID=2929801 RepID=UPI0028709D82|nr:hypothetical protein [Nonomuraea sp. 3-1Str]
MTNRCRVARRAASVSLHGGPRADVPAKLASCGRISKLIHHKIDVYRAGDADRLWAPVRPGAANPT